MEAEIKFFCECCNTDRNVIIEPLETDDLNPGKAWGDIVCKQCAFVIATISTTPDNAGEYSLMRTKFNFSLLGKSQP